ncbi:MAG TPA: hypothetical protein VFN49_00615, partial [Candidatus Aquilonibacter sp.]|nr:hypothetical protein [Candidatus Aquilonibacter sp.]
MRYAGIVFLASLVALLALAGCGGHGGSSLLPPGSPGGRAHLDTLATYSSIVLADGASAYYHLDDTGTSALDATGNGYNGTIGSSVVKSAAGLIAGTDTAMSFPGIKSASGLITYPRNSKLEAQTNVSLEAWIRFTTTPALYTVVV